MNRILFAVALTAGLAMAQYKAEPAGPAPSEAAPALTAALQPTGTKVLNAGGSVVCEVWFRNTLPAGSKSSESSVAFPSIPQGAFLGLIRFPVNGADRRGQTLKPGLYTMRYSLYPVNGDHQGVAPQRDFLVLSLAATDTDPNSLPGFDELMAMSRKASGTPHPAVLSMEPPESSAPVPGFFKEGEKDWVLNTKIGDLPVGVILIGKYEG